MNRCALCGEEKVWLGIFHLHASIPVYICLRCDRKPRGNS